jgi:hypothetical protein
MTEQITVHGLSELLDKFDHLSENVQKAVRAGIFAGAVHVQTQAKKYPPSTEANIPFQRRWYQRGWGSKWMRRDGSVGGKMTSKNLKQQWTVEMRDKYTVVIGNNVSYGPYVMGGANDEHQQAHRMKEIGWKTTDTIAEEQTPKVMEFIEKEIQKALNK